MRPAGFLVALWEYTQEEDLGKWECVVLRRFVGWLMRRYFLQHRYPHMLIEPREARYLVKRIDEALAKKERKAA
jgi:hypothetical protein